MMKSQTTLDLANYKQLSNQIFTEDFFSENAEQQIIEYPFDASVTEEIVVGEESPIHVLDLIPQVTFRS